MIINQVRQGRRLCQTCFRIWRKRLKSINKVRLRFIQSTLITGMG